MTKKRTEKCKKETDWNPLVSIFEKHGYKKSLQERACVDIDGNPIPWYTYPAWEYLSQLDFSRKRIFEFGCGNSSLWWASRSQEVISIESDENWYNSRLNANLPNLRMLLKQEEDYYNSILEQDGLFDVVVIDGFFRDECAKNAVKKLAPDGMIILDNSDRVSEFREYADAARFLKDANLIQIDFLGFGPLNNYTWATSLFLSKNFDFKSKSPDQPQKGIGGIKEV